MTVTTNKEVVYNANSRKERESKQLGNKVLEHDNFFVYNQKRKNEFSKSFYRFG